MFAIRILQNTAEVVRANMTISFRLGVWGWNAGCSCCLAAAPASRPGGQANTPVATMYSIALHGTYTTETCMKRKQCVMRWDDGRCDGGQLVLLAVAAVKLGRLQDSNHDGDARTLCSALRAPTTSLIWICSTSPHHTAWDCIACHPCIQSRYGRAMHPIPFYCFLAEAATVSCQLSVCPCVHEMRSN